MLEKNLKIRFHKPLYGNENNTISDPVEREKIIRQRVKDLVQENFVEPSTETNLSDEIIRKSFNLMSLMCLISKLVNLQRA